MASSSSGYIPPLGQASHSSSSRSPPHPAAIEDGSDDDDPVASYSRDQNLLSEDPLEGGEGDIVSFKRKRKPTTSSRFLSAITGSASALLAPTPSPRGGTPSPSPGRLHNLSTVAGNRDNSNVEGNKDGEPLDWYVEGPGRRVGYEDMTAIDWIFEYTKERQRLRMLYSNASGLFGYAQQFWDASQVWIVLILTGLAAGLCAAGIDVVSDWLGDLKTGYCSGNEDGGHFYLNKYFCCYGYDTWAECGDWVPWSLALHITSSGGKWFIEYFFFILYSVGFPVLNAQDRWLTDFLQVLFAVTASILVKEYALYAKHSGIPEIKTVLGGFVIRRFMGTWTLVIKSLGLVSLDI